MENESMFRVDGIVAVMTGGGTAGAGAKKVYILGRRKEVLEAAASSHPAIAPLSAVDVITKETGYVNLVVANLGLGGPPERWNPALAVSETREWLFDNVSMGNFTETFHVNVTGAYFTMLAFLKLLDAGNQNALKGGFGAPFREGSDIPSIQSQVVFTSSISAYSRMYLSAPAYSGSKAAIAHLTKHASTNTASKFPPRVFPSELATQMTYGQNPSMETPEDDRYITAQRFGRDEEMAGTTLYIANRAGAFCNGLILVMDGGKLSTMPSEY
ncbi:short chain dehydrogenase [Biscogniauxia marginata]|nr:short chain dehydrogenase [Biscogniauxia marginata]